MVVITRTKKRSNRKTRKGRGVKTQKGGFVEGVFRLAAWTVAGIASPIGAAFDKREAFKASKINEFATQIANKKQFTSENDINKFIEEEKNKLIENYEKKTFLYKNKNILKGRLEYLETLGNDLRKNLENPQSTDLTRKTSIAVNPLSRVGSPASTSSTASTASTGSPVSRRPSVSSMGSSQSVYNTPRNYASGMGPIGIRMMKTESGELKPHMKNTNGEFREIEFINNEKSLWTFKTPQSTGLTLKRPSPPNILRQTRRLAEIAAGVSPGLQPQGPTPGQFPRRAPTPEERQAFANVARFQSSMYSSRMPGTSSVRSRSSTRQSRQPRRP